MWKSCCRCPSLGKAIWDNNIDTSRQISTRPILTIQRRMPIINWWYAESTAFNSDVVRISVLYEVWIGVSALESSLCLVVTRYSSTLCTADYTYCNDMKPQVLDPFARVFFRMCPPRYILGGPTDPGFIVNYLPILLSKICFALSEITRVSSTYKST